MNFAPGGVPKFKRILKAEKLTPKLVKKKIHGQMVWVKVYPARWASTKHIGEMKGGPTIKWGENDDGGE